MFYRGIKHGHVTDFSGRDRLLSSWIMKEFLKVCTFWLFSFPLCNIFLSLLRPTLLSAVINIAIQRFFRYDWLKMDVTRTLLNVSPARLEIRNEETINSTRNRISSLKIFHVLLYRRSSISWDIYVSYRVRRLVSELFEYAYINARKSRASIREKLHHCQSAKTWWTRLVFSVIAENNPHARHKTHLHTMKVYKSGAIEGLLILLHSRF